MKRHSRVFLRLVAVGAMLIAGASPVAAQAASPRLQAAASQPASGCRTSPGCGFFDSHGLIASVNARGVTYVRDRAGRTHVVHFGPGASLWYMTRKHGAAPGRRGWSRRLVPGSRRLGIQPGIDQVALVLSPSGDRLYLVVRTSDRLYVVSKRPAARNFPAISAASPTVSAGLLTVGPQQLAVAALPNNELALLTNAAAKSGGGGDLRVYIVTPGHVESMTPLKGSTLDDVHGNALLSYDADTGWLIAAEAFRHGIFTWQRFLRNGNWTGKQRAVQGPSYASSLITMDGRAYLGAGVQSAHPRVFVSNVRLGTAHWSILHQLPHSPDHSSDLLLAADPAHNRLQAVYDINNAVVHEVRAANRSWSMPHQVSPRGETVASLFLVTTTGGGYRYAYECQRHCT
jgi:hypothetical protein